MRTLALLLLIPLGACSYTTYLSGADENGGTVNLVAVLIVVAISTILIIGVQESARFNAVIVFIKVAVVIVFIVAGYFYIDKVNYTPFVPPNTGKFGEFGWSGVLRGAER